MRQAPTLDVPSGKSWPSEGPPIPRSPGQCGAYRPDRHASYRPDLHCAVLDAFTVDPDRALLDHAPALRSTGHEPGCPQDLSNTETAILALHRELIDILGKLIVLESLYEGFVRILQRPFRRETAQPVPARAEI